jgi:hypothetical protein
MFQGTWPVCVVSVSVTRRAEDRDGLLRSSGPGVRSGIFVCRGTAVANNAVPSSIQWEYGNGFVSCTRKLTRYDPLMSWEPDVEIASEKEVVVGA